jgi:hypothetical protein
MYRSPDEKTRRHNDDVACQDCGLFTLKILENKKEYSQFIANYIYYTLFLLSRSLGLKPGAPGGIRTHNRLI